ncbi:RSP_7527 family protein [Jannaschia marina]|nr:hypothetical protein [Jannaschia marina]
MTQPTVDMIEIEARARAMRAAYLRDLFAGLVARLRGGRAAGAAHA